MDATDVPECLVAGDKNTHTHTKNSILLSGWFEGVCVWDAILSEALSFTLRYNISQKDIFMKNEKKFWSSLNTCTLVDFQSISFNSYQWGS